MVKRKNVVVNWNDVKKNRVMSSVARKRPNKIAKFITKSEIDVKYSPCALTKEQVHKKMRRLSSNGLIGNSLTIYENYEIAMTTCDITLMNTYSSNGKFQFETSFDINFLSLTPDMLVESERGMGEHLTVLKGTFFFIVKKERVFIKQNKDVTTLTMNVVIINEKKFILSEALLAKFFGDGSIVLH